MSARESAREVGISILCVTICPGEAMTGLFRLDMMLILPIVAAAPLAVSQACAHFPWPPSTQVASPLAGVTEHQTAKAPQPRPLRFVPGIAEEVVVPSTRTAPTASSSTVAATYQPPASASPLVAPAHLGHLPVQVSAVPGARHGVHGDALRDEMAGEKQRRGPRPRREDDPQFL